MIKLKINLIQQTFLMINLLIHDFLHDFDLRNSHNVSRLKRSQKIFSDLVSALPTEGGGMKGGAGEIHYFLRWVSGRDMRAARSRRPAAWGIASYDREWQHSAESTLHIFETLLPRGLARDFEANTPFLDEGVLQYIRLLSGYAPEQQRALRSRGDIVKKIRLVFNLVNDIILYTVGFLNTLGGDRFVNAVKQKYLEGPDEQQGGIDPTRRGSPGSLLGSPSKSQESPSKSQESPSKSQESPSKSQESLLGSPFKSQGSPERPLESNKPKKLTQQQKYNNYVSSFISAIDIFKFKASKEIEDEDNKKAYEIFLTNFGDVFKLVTQKYNTFDPFKILNSLDFKKILVVFLMVGENTDKSEILKGFLNNSLHSEKEKKINVSKLIKEYKKKNELIKKYKKKNELKEEPKPQESKVSKLIEFFEKKNIQKGGIREQELEELNDYNWKMFFTINFKMTSLINTLDETLQNSIQSLEELPEKDDRMIDVFVEKTRHAIREKIVKVDKKIQEFITNVNEWERPWEDQVINLDTTIGVLTRMNQDLSGADADLERLLAEDMEIFKSPRQQGVAAAKHTEKFQKSFQNIIYILDTFVSQEIGQLTQIKDTYLSQIEIKTNKINKELQKIRSADLTPEEILLGNKINRSYVVGMFKYLGLLNIDDKENKKDDELVFTNLVFTDRMELIIKIMRTCPDDKYCKLLALEFFILFKNRYTSDKLWSDFNNMTNKKFDWSTKNLGSGLDTQLINGVRNILVKDGVNYQISKEWRKLWNPDGPRNIINNAFSRLDKFNANQDTNVLCPYASIVDAMSQCSYSESSNWLNGGRLVEKNMNFTIKDMYGFYTYFGKIERRRPQGRQAEKPGQAAVNYTMTLTPLTGEIINVDLQNINLETSTILQANSVYANLLKKILEKMKVSLYSGRQYGDKLAVYVKNFWYTLATNHGIFKNLAEIGMRKGAGDFFQEVFATFQHNGGSEVPQVGGVGPIYGLMGDRPSGVRCIFFNLLGRDGNPGINKNNFSGYGTMDIKHNVIISADPAGEPAAAAAAGRVDAAEAAAVEAWMAARADEMEAEEGEEMGEESSEEEGEAAGVAGPPAAKRARGPSGPSGGFKKTRRNKRKVNKKTRRNKRKVNKKTRRNKRKVNKKTRKRKRKVNKKTRKRKRKSN